MERFITFMFITLTFISCSSGDKVKPNSEQIAVLDDGLILRESSEKGVMELVIPEVSDYTKAKDEAEEQANMGAIELGASDTTEQEEQVERTIASIGEEPEVDEYEEEEVAEDVTPEVAEVSAPYEDENLSNEYEDRFESYTVQKNDSLMLISFKLYNKFDNWRDLAQWNNVTSIENYTIREGDQLKFKVKGANGVVWNPNGNPYLVRKGDYLGLISQKTYNGSSRFWYDIWKNNDLLIHHPDRIYTGFTIYTESQEKVLENERLRKGKIDPMVERSLASEKYKEKSI